MEIIGGLVDVDLYRRGLRCCECRWGRVWHCWVRTSALLNMLCVNVFYVHAVVDACPSAHAN